MLRADKLACLEIPPVIRDVNVLPSVISREEPFAVVILTPSPVVLSPSPVILSAAKNPTQLRVDFAKNPQGLKGMQHQSFAPIIHPVKVIWNIGAECTRRLTASTKGVVGRYPPVAHQPRLIELDSYPTGVCLCAVHL